MLDLSIVIIGYKTRGLLKNCLNSIAKNFEGTKLDYEIVVVDNNSNDGTIELLQERYPEIKLIVMKKNRGYSVAVNRGIKENKAKYYFVLNPDTLFIQEKSIENLYNFMESNQEIGLAGPKLVNPDGSIQMSCCRFPSFFIPIYRRTFLGKLNIFSKKVDKFLMKDWDHQETRPVDWVIGTGMFVRNSALESVGGMDERFFMYFEDTDWCRRFWRAGWKVFYVADNEVIHYHGRPSLKSGGITDLFFNKGTRIHIASWLKYFSKYLFKYNINNNNFMDNKINTGGDRGGVNFNSEQLDFVPTSNSSTRNSKKRGGIKFLAIILLLALIIVSGYFYICFRQTKKYALLTKESFEKSYDYFIDFDFKQANIEIQNAKFNIEKTQDKMSCLKPLTFIGVIDRNYDAGKILLASIDQFADVFSVINNWGIDHITPIRESSGESISEFREQDKERLLKSLSEISPTLNEISQGTRLVREKLSLIPENGINVVIKSTSGNLDFMLENLEDGVYLAKEVLPVTVNSLGYPEEKLYLFALQNNGEIRPTGGFLGTYGVFKIKNAEFVEFDTYNTYHFDIERKANFELPAPAPIQKYLNSRVWKLSDANWSPDLPTSAKIIEDIYKTQSQDERDFDGLVIMDPMPIVELLKITGPIEIEDIVFSADNFIDELEHYTYQGFVEEGVASRDRKELIGKLGVEIINYFLNANLENWADVFGIVTDSLERKHVMFNFKDKNTQDFMNLQNWDNRIKEFNGDYLMVVDANMGSLKTDRYTEKKIKYSVTKDDDKFLAQVDLIYHNKARKSEKTSDLFEYTRIYVPFNAKLVRVIGTDEPVEETLEHDKKVFGTFWKIPMGETRKLTFEYELPRNIFSGNEYKLFVQKQAGTIGHQFEYNFSIDDVREVYQSNLDYDRLLNIKIN